MWFIVILYAFGCGLFVLSGLFHVLYSLFTLEIPFSFKIFFNLIFRKFFTLCLFIGGCGRQCAYLGRHAKVRRLLGNSILCFHCPGPRDCNALVTELRTLGMAAGAFTNYAI